MTAEEAIRHLKDLQRLYLGNERFTADIEAIGIAIEALEQEPCEDAISRADVKKYLSAPDANGDRVIYESDLDLLPTVIPQQKIGKWERYVNDYKKCSICEAIVKSYHSYKYCPNCGAKMLESEE